VVGGNAAVCTLLDDRDDNLDRVYLLSSPTTGKADDTFSTSRTDACGHVGGSSYCGG
jgi:hypothetical protein